MSGDPSELTGFAGWVADVLAAWGALGVGVLTAVENLFPPIPSEVVLPLAGYLAAQGRIDPVWAIVAATLGSLAGAIVIYELASWMGKDRLRRAVHRMPLVDWDDIDRADDWFERHGASAVFFGRFVPGVRSLVSLPAGTSGLGRVQFWALTALGSAIWNSAFIGAGWALGSAWTSVGRYSDWINYGLLVGFAGAVARFVWKRRDRMSFSREPRSTSDADRERSPTG